MMVGEYALISFCEVSVLLMSKQAKGKQPIQMEV